MKRQIKRLRMTAKVSPLVFFLIFVLGAGLGVVADRLEPRLSGRQDVRRGGARSPKVEAFFSPPSGVIEQKIISLIRLARNSIMMQAYSFTSLPIASAVIAAKAGGARVTVIADRSNLKSASPALKLIHKKGIPVYIDTVKGIAHNKVIVIDGQTVITGSFNFSKAAETRNAENIVVIYDRMTADAYIQNIRFRIEHAKPLIKEIIHINRNRTSRSDTRTGQS